MPDIPMPTGVTLDLVKRDVDMLITFLTLMHPKFLDQFEAFAKGVALPAGHPLHSVDQSIVTKLKAVFNLGNNANRINTDFTTGYSLYRWLAETKEVVAESDGDYGSGSCPTADAIRALAAAKAKIAWPQ